MLNTCPSGFWPHLLAACLPVCVLQFHATEYPAFHPDTFPIFLGNCQANSTCNHHPRAMDLRNVLWFQVRHACAEHLRTSLTNNKRTATAAVLRCSVMSAHTAPGGVCCCCRASWLCWMWGPAAPCMPCCMKAPSRCEQSMRRTLAQQLRTCCCCSNPTAGAAAYQQRSSWRPSSGTG